MKLFARRALAFLFWSPVLLAAAGCNNQGEGERCDTANLSTDCDQGLICTDKAYVAGVYHQICCPVPPAPHHGASLQYCRRRPSPRRGHLRRMRRPTAAQKAALTRPRNDAVDEPTDDRVTIDTTAEISRDMSARSIDA